MWQFWLIAAGIFFIVEIATTGFLVFWFGLGALIALIVSLFTANVYIQATIFLISSTIFILCTKPLINKFVSTKKTIATNSYSIIGKTGLVISEINPTLGKGQVKINGDTWSAKSANDEIIPTGTDVKILKIDGVKVIVTTLVSASQEETVTK